MSVIKAPNFWIWISLDIFTGFTSPKHSSWFGYLIPHGLSSWQADSAWDLARGCTGHHSSLQQSRGPTQEVCSQLTCSKRFPIPEQLESRHCLCRYRYRTFLLIRQRKKSAKIVLYNHTMITIHSVEENFFGPFNNRVPEVPILISSKCVCFLISRCQFHSHHLQCPLSPLREVTCMRLRIFRWHNHVAN